MSPQWRQNKLHLYCCVVRRDFSSTNCEKGGQDMMSGPNGNVLSSWTVWTRMYHKRYSKPKWRWNERFCTLLPKRNHGQFCKERGKSTWFFEFNLSKFQLRFHETYSMNTHTLPIHTCIVHTLIYTNAVYVSVFCESLVLLWY